MLLGGTYRGNFERNVCHWENKLKRHVVGGGIVDGGGGGEVSDSDIVPL